MSLRDELQRFLDGEPTLAKPVGSIRYAWNWYWHNLTKVAGSLTIACCGIYAICVAVGLVQLFEITSEGPGPNGPIENFLLSLMFMVPIFILALVVVLIGAKCGLLTIRGHKLGIVGSICVLGFITLSVVSDFSKIPEGESPELRRSAILLSSYAYTFAIWYAFCLLSQFLALLTPDQRASHVALADDVASIRRGRSRLVQSFIFMAFGVIMIASTRLSDVSPPGIGLAGLISVLAGILIAFRFR